MWCPQDIIILCVLITSFTLGKLFYQAVYLSWMKPTRDLPRTNIKAQFTFIKCIVTSKYVTPSDLTAWNGNFLYVFFLVCVLDFVVFVYLEIIQERYYY